MLSQGQFQQPFHQSAYIFLSLHWLFCFGLVSPHLCLSQASVVSRSLVPLVPTRKGGHIQSKLGATWSKCLYRNCWDWQNHICTNQTANWFQAGLRSALVLYEEPMSCPRPQSCFCGRIHWGPKERKYSRSVTSNSATPWTVAHQDPLSMEFSWQEFWCGLPFPSPGDLPNLGIKPRFAMQDSLPAEPPGKPLWLIVNNNIISCSFIHVYPMTLMVLVRHLLNSLGIINIFWKNTLELQEAEPCGLWMQISWNSNQIFRYIQIPHGLTGWVSLPIF